MKKNQTSLKESLFQLVIELKAVVLMKLNHPTPINSEDRQILERIILPFFAKNFCYDKILFVGTEKYTWHYKKMFKEKEYWTIEPRFLNRIYGAKHHIVGYLDQIDRYFAEDSFDVIICNGVLGYGLNDPKEIESSFEKTYRCLKENGVLVIGWNNIKEWPFLPLDKYKSIQKFEHFYFEPLRTNKYETKTPNCHTYSFYIKQSGTKK